MMKTTHRAYLDGIQFGWWSLVIVRTQRDRIAVTWHILLLAAHAVILFTLGPCNTDRPNSEPHLMCTRLTLDGY
jgi:hypothetical protein